VTSREVKRHGNNSGKRVAVLDCGMKLSILRDLLKRGCDVTVFPAKSTASEVLDSQPDGVVVSNGPGDPKMAGYAVDTITGLMEEKTPIFGICLGHQLLSLAVGADTYKLKLFEPARQGRQDREGEYHLPESRVCGHGGFAEGDRISGLSRQSQR